MPDAKNKSMYVTQKQSVRQIYALQLITYAADDGLVYTHNIGYVSFNFRLYEHIFHMIYDMIYMIWYEIWYDIDGLVQERRNSSVLAMELHLSCTNPSIYNHIFVIEYFTSVQLTIFHSKSAWIFISILRN